MVPQGKEQFANIHLAREKAKNIKWKAIETLDKQLENFEANITRRGAKVIWAETAEEALNEILKICRDKNCKTIVKSKSMVKRGDPVLLRTATFCRCSASPEERSSSRLLLHCEPLHNRRSAAIDPCG